MLKLLIFYDKTLYFCGLVLARIRKEKPPGLVFKTIIFSSKYLVLEPQRAVNVSNGL